ncbi:O-antigen ligase family protein [Serratia symbiotica]|uniref:O-antigen ligase family protein n=1 Tax=Serratia symbiotica TaxID=138074 RepID=UPI0030CEC165|nr:O-antigen ligase family protein [Serratia symbiotica]
MNELENMFIKVKSDCVKRNAFFVAFIMLIVILPIGFVNEKSARVAFYLCGYISILGILLDYKNIKWIILNNKQFYPFLALSILFFSWSVICTFHEYPKKSQGTLFTPAKRWLLSYIISIFLISNLNKIISDRRVFSKLAFISLFSSFVISSGYGIMQSYNGIDRILLGIDRATLTAYIYSALSLTVISILSRIEKPSCRWPLLIPSWLISVYVIIATGTRSATLIHTLISLSIILSAAWKNKSVLSKTMFLFFLIALFFSVICINKTTIQHQAEMVVKEIFSYSHGNDHTSLGSRFTLWKTGLIAFHEQPFGQTQLHRNRIIKDYLNSVNPNSFALEYIDVHLHNELIQYISIFGIFGAVILLYFYISLIFKFFLKKSMVLIVVTALLYGLTDLLLTSIEYITLFSALFILNNIYR